MKRNALVSSIIEGYEEPIKKFAKEIEEDLIEYFDENVWAEVIRAKIKRILKKYVNKRL